MTHFLFFVQAYILYKYMEKIKKEGEVGICLLVAY